MLPSLFISHGSPNLSLQNNEYTNFLKDLGNKIKPECIVIFTAHFESDVVSISFMDGIYNTIYDFGGFPKELYEIKYNAKGSISVASKLEFALKSQGIETKRESARGLDHGAWSLLNLMYPKANIPIVQVSVNPRLSPMKQYEIGKSIQSIKEDDVLIIGSGGTVHNLSSINFASTKPEVWAEEFDNSLIDMLEKRDLNSIFNYDKLIPNAKAAVPTPEHLAPLFIALGSSNEYAEPKLLHRSYDLGTLSQICFMF